MSKENEGSVVVSEGTKQAEGLDVNELQKRVEQLEASNKRLLDESKGYKEKYKATVTEVTKKDEELALKAGDLQKLLDMERNKKSELQNELNATRQKILKQEIKTVVSEFATDAISLDDVLNQPNFAPILQEAVDPDSLTVDRDKAKRFVDEVRKQKLHLFKPASQPHVVTQKPNQEKPMHLKGVKELTSKEIEDLLRSGQYK